MTLPKLCGLVILAAVLLLLLRETGGKLAPLGAATAGVVLLLFLVERYGRIYEFLAALPGGELTSSVLSFSLRVLGLSLLAELTAGVCRDLGEAGLAARLEWCCRAEILVLSLPTLEKLLGLAVSYLG